MYRETDMKNTLWLIAGTGLLLMACSTIDGPSNGSSLPEEVEQPEAALRATPFSRGVNFSGWLEAYSAQGISFTRYSEADFANVKSLGADVVRLPISMHSMTAGAPAYTLDPLLLKFLDSAVDWAEKHELYIIIDNHSFDPVEHTANDIDKILIPVWEQVARRYQDRSDYVIYEVLNEPHGISDSRWGEIQGKVIDAIRRIDPKHTIIVGGTDFNSIGKLSAIPEYADQNLIYTFHFYDPYLFTHQGASWGGPPVLTTLVGVPFPADSKRMPKVSAELKGTWIESSLNYSYRSEATASKLYSTLDRAVAFSRARDVPVFCGEFGVYMIQSPAADRVTWYEVVSGALDRRNISRASWDYFGGFGIFNNEWGGDFFADLNTGVVRAMGFTPPPQRTQPLQPLAAGFTLYDDYPGREYSAGYWGDSADFSLYDTRTAAGEYAIRWSNAEQYNIFWFGFDRNGDFSEIAGRATLELMARAEQPVRFDIRFVNPEDASTVPWRMRCTIDETVLPPDGKWHTIRIPLSDMREHGAWVNAVREWREPQGKFTWKKVRQLEFVAEYGDMKNQTVWFDSIKVIVP
jgi:endoglucanase